MKIIRFYRDDRPSKVIKTGLTLEEAQAHCRREDTHDHLEGWFDGYEDEDEDRDFEAEAVRTAELRSAVDQVNALLR